MLLLAVPTDLDKTRFPFSGYLPKVRTSGCQRVQDLNKARYVGYLAALFREDLDIEKKIDDAHVRSQNFISGKPADLLDELNLDWLPP